MTCKNCGTEIAERALICFRCGAAVNEAVYKPAVIRKKRPTIVYVVFAVLVVVALVLMYLR